MILVYFTCSIVFATVLVMYLAGRRSRKLLASQQSELRTAFGRLEELIAARSLQEASILAALQAHARARGEEKSQPRLPAAFLLAQPGPPNSQCPETDAPSTSVLAANSSHLVQSRERLNPIAAAMGLFDGGVIQVLRKLDMCQPPGWDDHQPDGARPHLPTVIAPTTAVAKNAASPRARNGQAFTMDVHAAA